MGACQWNFILATIVLLLDSTFGDVLVQPGYGQPGKIAKNSVAQNQAVASQPPPTAKSQQSYFPQQNSAIQLLQQQHALEHQYLQHQHQQEHNQLLQLQQMELQHPAIRQQQNTGQDIVGSPWGLPFLPSPGPFGALAGTKLFTLGPLGLNSFRLGGGGLAGFPLLLSPHQQGQMQGSTQYQKSMDGPTQPRAKRDVRDSGDPSGKKYRQKIPRVHQDGMATNPTVKSKLDSNSQNVQTTKTNDQMVGDAHSNNNEDTVGSSLLDPLGLVDKTEDLIDDLKSGHLPNPLNTFTHSGLLPSWLSKGTPEAPKFEEHVVGQSQYQNPSEGRNNVMNQQLYQSQQQPIVGDTRHGLYPIPHPLRPSQSPGLYRPPGYYNPGPYGPGLGGGYVQPYPYRPSPQYLFRSLPQQNVMNMQRSGMSYGGSPMIGSSNPSIRQSGVQTNWGNPLTRSTNPSVQEPVMKNPVASKPQMMEEKSSGSGKMSSTMNSMRKDRIVGAPNPQSTLGSPGGGGYERIVGAPNPTESLYELAKMVQPMMGTLLDPMSGEATPYNYQPGGQNSMFGNPMMNSPYDQSNGRMNYYGYNNGFERHVPFGMDDMYDDRYHHMHHGGYNRIYETLIDEGPFGRPHYVQSHEGYIL